MHDTHDTAPSPLLQLPMGVWSQSILRHLCTDDQQMLALSCQQARSIVAASAVTQLSISQDTMIHLPTTLPPAFTAVRHLTLNLSGNLMLHTLPFLQSFLHHCAHTLAGLTSLKLLLGHSLPEQLAAQLAALLGSCPRLSEVHLATAVTGVDQSLQSREGGVTITLREPAPGSGLHHLSHCFPQCHTRPLYRCLTDEPFCHLIHTLHRNDDVWSDVAEELAALPQLPALQDLSVAAIPKAATPLMATTLSALSSLTCLRLTHGSESEPRSHVNHFLHQCIPSLTLLRDLELGARAFRPILPPAWSSLQGLTKLTLQQLTLAPDSGLWHLGALERLCLFACTFLPLEASPTSLGLHSLTGLKHLDLLLTDSLPAFLPPSISKLSWVTFSGRTVDWQPQLSTLAGSLRDVSLLHFEAAASLAASTRLSSLQSLKLSCTSYTADCNLHCLTAMSQLTSLTLAASSVCKTLANLHLQGMTYLQSLVLEGSMSLARVAAVPSSLTSLKSVTLGVEGCEMSLPQSLRHCKSLQVLRCSNNAQAHKLSDPSATLSHLTSLRHVELAMVAPTFAAAMGPMPLLTYLSVRTDVPDGDPGAPPPAFLQRSVRLKALMLHGFDALPPAFPAGLAKLVLDVDGVHPCILPQHWACKGLRYLRLSAPRGGVSGVSTLAALTMLTHLQLRNVSDANVDSLDALTRLATLKVHAMNDCEVGFWLPQLKALYGSALLDMCNCYEVPPPSPHCDGVESQ